MAGAGPGPSNPKGLVTNRSTCWNKRLGFPYHVCRGSWLDSPGCQDTVGQVSEEDTHTHHTQDTPMYEVSLREANGP